MRLTREIIAEHECWDLLETESVGRVAITIKALPAIACVGYSVDGAKVAIALHPDETIPENALDDAIVAFEVDTFDAATHIGWIVHVIGRVHRAEQTTNSGNCAQRQVQLVAKVITGQRVRVDQ